MQHATAGRRASLNGSSLSWASSLVMTRMQIASVFLLLSCLTTTQRQDRRPAVASAFTVVESPSEIRMAMVPKFANLLVFEQAYGGAVQAYEELSSKGELQYIPPETPTDSGAAQIDFISRATVSQFYNTILLSNNAGDGIAGAALDASNHGTSIVTWDSPIPSGKQGGEEFFVSQVDFDSTGRVMADMAKRILPQGGKVAILSAAREATNQNQWISAMKEVMNSDAEKYGSLELIDEIVYGNDDALVSFQMANYILDTYPVSLIMAPTSVGITQASRAVSERQLCDSIKVSGLGLPVEMLDHTLSGCAPVFALWSFVDLGYLTYYAAYRLKTGELAEVKDGAAFDAGRLGTKVLQRDPTRGNFDAYRVIMGDFTLYDRNNIERAVVNSALQNDLKGQQYTFEQRYIEKYKRKALAIIPKVTGMISFVFSAYIVYHVLFDPKRRRSLKNRLLVGISIHDMIADLFGFFLSTWPMPADTWLVYGAVGTTQSCTMQGFFFQAGIGAAPLYSAALTTFYLLNVVFNMSPENIAKHAGKWLHGIPILFGWGTAIAGLPLNLYNAADRVGFMCWIAEFPTYCSLRGNCERGQNAGAYRWAFLYSWVFAVFLYMTICMFWIYCKVLKTEKATDRWTKASGQHPRRAMSHKVACQGFQYVAAFIFPWIFGIVVSVMMDQSYGNLSLSAQIDNSMTALELTSAFIWPLKGFFTFLAYMRPIRKRRVRQSGNSDATGGNKFSVVSFVRNSVYRILMPHSSNHFSEPGHDTCPASNGPASAPIEAGHSDAPVES